MKPDQDQQKGTHERPAGLKMPFEPEAITHGQPPLPEPRDHSLAKPEADEKEDLQDSPLPEDQKI